MKDNCNTKSVIFNVTSLLCIYHILDSQKSMHKLLYR